MNHPKFKQLYTISSFSVDETEADIPTLDFDIPELVGAGAFNILDVLIDGYDRVRLMTGKDLGQLYAFWATGTDTTDTLYCSQYFYELGICSQLGAVSVQGKDTDRDEYDDMVILKEFFKFALEQVSLDDNPGGYHDGTRDDPRRAWTEGVTTFFAADVLGYHYFINSKPSGVYLLQNLETMLSPFAFGTASDTMDGPLSEYLVSAVLFDIADSDDNETFDALNDAGFALYDAIFNYFPSEYFVDRGFTGVDLVDFLDGWFCRGWNQNNSISAIVTDHRLFPYDFASQGECIH
jgi:hypothetical protein